MNKMIISVVGKDRPGIIAAVTKILFEKEFNIEDVSQTILQKQFSGIFIVSGPPHLEPNAVSNALKTATSKFHLHFHVLDFESNNCTTWTACGSEPFVITTMGPDRKGLVANITALLADHNVNVAQLQAVFRGGNTPGKNIMIYEVDIPTDTDQKKLRQALKHKADELSLHINIQHKRIFKAINRI